MKFKIKKKTVIKAVITVPLLISLILFAEYGKRYVFYPEDKIYFNMSEFSLMMKKGMPIEKSQGSECNCVFLSYNESFENYRLESCFRFSGGYLLSVNYTYIFDTYKDKSAIDEFYYGIKEKIVNYYTNRYSCDLKETKYSANISTENLYGATGISVEISKISNRITVDSEYLW